jgi:hypothetical protein
MYPKSKNLKKKKPFNMGGCCRGYIVVSIGSKENGICLLRVMIGGVQSWVDESILKVNLHA